MNWYTSELRMSLYDAKSNRLALIDKLTSTSKGRYALSAMVSNVISNTTRAYFSTLKSAKAAGKAWVEQGVKPEGGSK